MYSSSCAGYMVRVSPLFTCSLKVLFTYSVEGYTLKSYLLDWYSIVIVLMVKFYVESLNPMLVIHAPWNDGSLVFNMFMEIYQNFFARIVII